VFDATTGVLRRQFHSDTRILAAAGGRYLTSNEYDPTSGYGAFNGMVMSPSFRFRPPCPTDPPDYEWPILDDHRVFRRPGRTKAGEPFAAFDLIVRELAGGRVVATIPAPRNPEATVKYFALSPDGRFVAAEFEEDVLVWDVDTGRRLLRVG